MLLSVLAPGCLVADPPEYREPPRTPPILDLVAAKPLISEIIVRDTRTGLDADRVIEFVVPLRSEDNDEYVWWAFHIDYGFAPPSETLIGVPQRITPSTFDDVSRSINYKWDIPSVAYRAGCHTITLVVSHDSTWNLVEARPHVIEGQHDTAMATWWLNLNPPPDARDTLLDCPTHSEVEQ
ncbi:MAG TPA: hypothetical protein VKY73_09780 [Polyangiaceae bacterium]|nr:hypothetical protein [Polyangiaceae bacterium]